MCSYLKLSNGICFYEISYTNPAAVLSPPAVFIQMLKRAHIHTDHVRTQIKSPDMTVGLLL